MFCALTKVAWTLCIWTKRRGGAKPIRLRPSGGIRRAQGGECVGLTDLLSHGVYFTASFSSHIKTAKLQIIKN